MVRTGGGVLGFPQLFGREEASLPATESLSHTDLLATNMFHIIVPPARGSPGDTTDCSLFSHELPCSAATRLVPHDTVLHQSPRVSVYSGTAQPESALTQALRPCYLVHIFLGTAKEAEFSHKYVHLV